MRKGQGSACEPGAGVKSGREAEVRVRPPRRTPHFKFPQPLSSPFILLLSGRATFIYPAGRATAATFDPFRRKPQHSPAKPSAMDSDDEEMRDASSSSSVEGGDDGDGDAAGYAEEGVMVMEVRWFEVDLDYEYDAPRWFDLAREEAPVEAAAAEMWFATAPSYPPSRTSAFFPSNTPLLSYFLNSVFTACVGRFNSRRGLLS